MKTLMNVIFFLARMEAPAATLWEAFSVTALQSGQAETAKQMSMSALLIHVQMETVLTYKEIMYASVMKAGLTPSVMLTSMNVIYCHPVVEIVGPATTQRVASTAPVNLGFQAPPVARIPEIHAPVVHVEKELVPV